MYKAVLCALLVGGFYAFADAVDPEIKALCDQGLEGTAITSVELVPKVISKIRMNLICVKDGHMTGSSWDQDLGHTNLTYSFVEHSTSLELSQVPLGDDSSSTSDGTSLTMAHFNISKLLNGEVEGWFINGNMTREKLIRGTIEKRFPQLSSFPSFPLSEEDLNGTYALRVPFEGKLHNTEVWLRVAQHVVRARMKIDQAFENMVPFVDGPVYDGSGRFKTTTASGNGEKTGRPIWNLRGYATGPGKLELYWINPKDGLLGPFEATKVFSSANLFTDQDNVLNKRD